MTVEAATAAQMGLMSCEACQMLSRPAAGGQPAYCRRCGERLEFRHHGSIQKTWALVTAAAICYIPANLLPVLKTTTLGDSEGDTILSGVAFLYATGSWPLALIVLVASVMIPLGKLVALSYLLLTVQRGSIKSNHERTRLYRLVELIGRWSMLEVMMLGILVALIKIAQLATVHAGLGMYAVGALILLFPAIVVTFDSRALWRRVEWDHDDASAVPASGATTAGARA